VMPIGLVALMIEGQLQDIVFLLVETLYHCEVRSNQWYGQPRKLSIELCHKDLVRCCGCEIFYQNINC
jgi:hypothetical protein